MLTGLAVIAAAQTPDPETFIWAWLGKVTKTNSGYRYEVDMCGDTHAGESGTPPKVRERTNVKIKLDGRARVLHIIDEDGAIQQTRDVLQACTWTRSW